MKVARISTTPMSILGYRHHYEYLEKNGVSVTLICSKDKNFTLLKSVKVSHCHLLNIKREINILHDLITTFKLYRYFKNRKFDIVHSNTPKAGLLTAIAGFSARIPVRIHTFTGQRWLTLKGYKKRLLILIDQLIVWLNTACFADGPDQIKLLIANKIGRDGQISCIHKGSFAGIDFEAFSYDKYRNIKNQIQRELHIDSRSIIITYVGRIVKDKGINELVRAFLILRNNNIDVKLILIGLLWKDRDPIDLDVEKEISKNRNILYLGYVDDLAKYLSITDIFCIPSYREGFSSVILEAAAMKVPSVGSRIAGIQDAIIDGDTGILVDKKDAIALKNALDLLCKNRKLRNQMGEKAYQRAREGYDHRLVGENVIEIYQSLMGQIQKPHC